MAKFINNDSDEWICIRILGSGSFGIVELWNNTKTMDKIAVKKCQITVNNITAKQKERWNHEVLIMNQLNHPNIVATRNISNSISVDSNGLPVLCMEYCSKGDLRNLLNKCENLCGVQENDAINIINDVASAVEYLHHCHITHRDLKPNNIVMQQMNGKIVYKLIDLGYAKELGDASISASIVGTLNYLAPELLWKETYSCSVDYWSLGILFYEIITGVRPFLPNMQLTKIWMNYVERKGYDDISAREINGQVYFYQNIEDTTYLSDYFKLNLVEWFRIVFQWDPKKRGKSEDSHTSDQLVVFTMLKSIFEMKIVHTFVVLYFKFESYPVNLPINVEQLKRIIYDREGIDQCQLILTDSSGKIMKDEKILTDKLLQENVIIVFHSEILCIETIPKPKLSQSMQEIIKQPRMKCDYHTLRRYYGDTIFFMNNELKLYRSYILALSIIIDLCNTRLQLLNTNIEILISDSQLLLSELESTENLIENCKVDSYTDNFRRLKQKISKFFDGTKQMMEKFNVIAENNKEINNFSNVNWMNEMSTPYDKALNLINEWNKQNHNQLDTPCAMVKLIFEFLSIRDKQLSITKLDDTGRNIMHYQKELVQLEKVLTSFMELSKLYRHDMNNLHESLIKPNDIVSEMIEDSTCIVAEHDSVIYESIVISNMLGGLLDEMDVWRRKLATLSNSDN